MPKRQIIWNCSYSDFSCVISGFTLNDRAPGDLVTFWWPMSGQRLPKLQNVPIWLKCAKTAKNVQSSKSPKSPKTALSGLSQECVSECSVSARVSIQGSDRPRSLVQPSPAFSSWIQPGQGPGALPSCPKAQGECLASRELPREVTRPRSPSQYPGMSSGQAQEKLLFQPIGSVPRTEKHMFSGLRKTLSWAFYFIYLTFKKLKFYFSCFYLCSKEVRHIGISLPVSHICLQIAFPVSLIGFTIS